VLAAVTAVVALAPLGDLVVRVAEAGPSQVLEALIRERTWQTAGTSLALALAVIACCLALGLPMSWILARTAVPLVGVWLVLASLPLAIPSYVAAYAWLAQFPGMHGFWAATLVLTMVSMPYVVLPVTAALALHGSCAGGGRSHPGPWADPGLRPGIPAQAWPAAAAGSLLVGLYVLSDFGAVALLRVDAFSRVIYASYRASFDRTGAAVLALVLVALAAVFVLIERRVRGRSHRYRVALRCGPAASAADLVTRRSSCGHRVCISAVASVAIAFPVASLMLRMAEGVRRSLDLAELLSAVLSSAGVSLIGAVIADRPRPAGCDPRGEVSDSIVRRSSRPPPSPAMRSRESWSACPWSS
jgi:iron(III) transport system permease protein